MKTTFWVVAITGALMISPLAGAAPTNGMAMALQQGLFEEEANNNLEAAIQAYTSVVGQFDKDRKLAGTAIYRLGECRRKQGKTNEAAAFYARIVTEFSDLATLADLSRQNLAGLGVSRTEITQASGLPTGAPVTSQEDEEVKRIRALIQNSPDLINAYTDGFAPLHKAANAGQLVVARFLLENGANVNTPARANNDKRTPLQMAAKKGHRALVQLLLQNKADVNAAEQQRQKTALLYAAGEGFIGVVEVLLEAGADPEAADSGGTTPLHEAAGQGHAALAEMLIARGADVKVRDGNGCDPLHYAAAAGHTVMATLLLKHGAEVNMRSRYGETPLARAVDRNHFEMAKLLLSHKADPNLPLEIKGSDSQLRVEYPIHTAVSQKSKELTQLLLEHGADPNLLRESGQERTSVLIMAVWIPAEEIAETLLSGGADPNLGQETGTGDTPLTAALKKGLEKTCGLLIDRKADANLADSSGSTALHYSLGLPQLLERILTTKPDMNAKNKEGQTPLHWAVSSGLKSAAEALIKHGANVNTQDKEGLAPLHFAMIAKNKDMLSLLLANDADPNIRDQQGRTPLDMEKNYLAKNEFRPAPGVAVWQWQLARLPGLSAPPPPPIVSVPTRTLRFPGQTAAAPPQSEYAELLRRHGAMDVLPNMEAIQVSRSGKTEPWIVFRKGTNDWNRFTLLEALGVAYTFLDSTVDGKSERSKAMMGVLARETAAIGHPDLTRIQIRRPGGNVPLKWNVITVNVAQILETGDCSKDVALEWGDVVDIPEADHVLGESWKGFSLKEVEGLANCWKREVEVIVKGKRTTLKLGAEYETVQNPEQHPEAGSVVPKTVWVEQVSVKRNAPLWLRPVLRDSNLLLASSDLSRIKVTRIDKESGMKKEYVVDCLDAQPAPDFWLKNGDVIEVPDR